MSHGNFQSILDETVTLARENKEGSVASYIPELAQVPEDLTGIALMLNEGACFFAGDAQDQRFTLQSIAKLVILIGLLEEHGPQNVFSWVRVEPSGDDFASVARLDQFGPLASNPMLNSGAITLCSHIVGNTEQRLTWLEKWMARLFGQTLSINPKVFSSERRTGDRNRALAYLLKSNKVIDGDVDHILEIYFYLCSFEANITQCAYLPMLLANGGLAPDGERVISKETVQNVVAIMATCGLYNESGTHLVKTGLPAKSSVSGLIISVAPKHGGIAVASPKVNSKGTSVRGEIILETLAKKLDWHFAA